MQSNTRRKETGQAVLGFITLVLIVLVAGCVASFRQVERGTVKVVTQKGAVTEKVLGPGWHFITPIVQGTVEYETVVQSYETSDNVDTSKADWKDYPVSAQTSDGQQISIKYTLMFHIPDNGVAYIAQNVGSMKDVVENVVKAHSRSNFRLIAQNYTAEQLYSGAGDTDVWDYRQEVFDKLAEAFFDYGIYLDEVLIRKIEFDVDYIAAIEAQQIAEEKIKTAEFRAEEAKFERDQAITVAEGEAQRTRLLANAEAENKVALANGEAESMVLLAEAEATAIELKGKALKNNPDILSLEFIQRLEFANWIAIPNDGISMFLPTP